MALVSFCVLPVIGGSDLLELLSVLLSYWGSSGKSLSFILTQKLVILVVALEQWFSPRAVLSAGNIRQCLGMF